MKPNAFMWSGCALVFVFGFLFGAIVPEAEFWKVKASDLISLIASIATTVSVLVAVYFGTKSLNSWKVQETTKVYQGLAHRLAAAFLNYRESIIHLRLPVIWATEMYADDGTEDVGSFREIDFIQKRRAYSKRLDRVYQCRREIYLLLLEVEFHWGKELAQLFEDLYKFEKEVNLYIDNHLRSINPKADDAEREAYRAINAERRNVLMDMKHFEEGDDFTKSFVSSVNGVLDYLKNKMHA